MNLSVRMSSGLNDRKVVVFSSKSLIHTMVIGGFLALLNVSI